MPLRRIDEMLPGTVGFEAIGEVEDAVWRSSQALAAARDLRGQKIHFSEKGVRFGAPSSVVFEEGK
jgi:hypothetical protein